jgi:hypothetical protein
MVPYRWTRYERRNATQLDQQRCRKGNKKPRGVSAPAAWYLDQLEIEGVLQSIDALT